MNIGIKKIDTELVFKELAYSIIEDSEEYYIHRFTVTAIKPEFTETDMMKYHYLISTNDTSERAIISIRRKGGSVFTIRKRNSVELDSELLYYLICRLVQILSNGKTAKFCLVE